MLENETGHLSVKKSPYERLPTFCYYHPWNVTNDTRLRCDYASSIRARH
jgi:hypothetical protein